MERRKFIKNTISFSMLLAFHKQALGDFSNSDKELSIGKGIVRFPKVSLYSHKLEECHQYYSKVLGLKILTKTDKEFSIEIGESILVFKEAEKGTEPFYHYAINIPSNKYKEAKKWLSERTELLKDEGSGTDLFYFGFWDAHAMYFKDPSGNIGELIARHTMDNDKEGEFDTSHLLAINEIGTPVHNPSDLASELKAEYGLDEYGDSMFIGDENGLFVAVPIHRPWIPENTQRAAIHPTEIQISDKGKSQFNYKDYPYTIKSKN